MRYRLVTLFAVAVLSSPLALSAGDSKQKKEAEEAQAKADKAQAKADKEAAKYNEETYRQYVKDQNKADKEWAKLDAKEREDYYKWLKKHKMH
jgi:Ni/Co efflux regulator RcnB